MIYNVFSGTLNPTQSMNNTKDRYVAMSSLRSMYWERELTGGVVRCV